MSLIVDSNSVSFTALCISRVPVKKADSATTKLNTKLYGSGDMSVHVKFIVTAQLSPNMKVSGLQKEDESTEIESYLTLMNSPLGSLGFNVTILPFKLVLNMLYNFLTLLTPNKDCVLS